MDKEEEKEETEENDNRSKSSKAPLREMEIRIRLISVDTIVHLDNKTSAKKGPSWVSYSYFKQCLTYGIREREKKRE